MFWNKHKKPVMGCVYAGPPMEEEPIGILMPSGKDVNPSDDPSARGNELQENTKATYPSQFWKKRSAKSPSSSVNVDVYAGPDYESSIMLIYAGPERMDARDFEDSQICPQCGATIRITDKFCSTCGHAMT